MKVILVVLDGWGIAAPGFGNAITSARTPTLQFLESSYPSCLLQASGIAVGLPWGEPGNSETGHLALGAGRTVFQSITRIETSIQDGSFFKNQTLKNAASHVKKNKSSLHLMGLVSSGSVHSYIDHLYALLDFAKLEGISNVFLHIFTDGKDSPPQEAAKFVALLTERMRSQNRGTVASL
ncbi:MAG: 2,3-bisphosphoglycerate-independent phosphoglycerate mutase, partial [Candidatus Spechtbacteria bacterium]|nr:2,3-bisphosphoglycerate-independent phosphoglycerate mutase [Candidatus Spechtbacteria bacterium]